MHVDTFIHADLKEFFRQTAGFKTSASPAWLAYAENTKKKFDPFEGAGEHDDKRVNPYTFWKTYAQKIPSNGITCLGNSSSIGGWLRYGNITKDQRSFVNINCGSMGDDITLAAGVACAAKRPVVIQTGDGSIMMNLQELATIRHNNLAVKIIVFPTAVTARCVIRLKIISTALIPAAIMTAAYRFRILNILRKLSEFLTGTADPIMMFQIRLIGCLHGKARRF